MPKYERLGWKTFWLFVIEKSKPAFLILIISVTLLLLKNTLSGDFLPLIDKALVFLGVIFLLSFSISIVNSFVEYLNYGFLLDEHALKIRRGIISKEEIAIPYRQIQNINIEQSVWAQMLGISRLVIETAGNQTETLEGKHQAEGILPGIDRNLAYRIRDEVLRKAHIDGR